MVHECERGDPAWHCIVSEDVQLVVVRFVHGKMDGFLDVGYADTITVDLDACNQVREVLPVKKGYIEGTIFSHLRSIFFMPIS
jgi:hypothetical protein